MTRAEYEKLIATAKENDNLRLAMIIEIIGSTGMRISELASVTVEAVGTGKISIQTENETDRLLQKERHQKRSGLHHKKRKPGRPQQHLDGDEKKRRKSRRCTEKSIPA